MNEVHDVRRPTKQPTVCVTGATGVIGREIVKRLLPFASVIAIARDARSLEDMTGNVNLRVVEADMTAGDVCDLITKRLLQSGQSLDAIVHAAAITEWGLSVESYRTVNVTGTERMIAAAEHFDCPLHYLSSAFVAAVEPTEGAAQFDLPDSNKVKPYVTSKLIAEQIVRRGGDRNTIYRITNLVGCVGTGSSSRPQIVHHLAEWIARGRASILPFGMDAPIDILPLDVVAADIVDRVLGDKSGGLRWLTAGRNAPSIREFLAVVEDHVRAERAEKLSEVRHLIEETETGHLSRDVESVRPSSRPYLAIAVDIADVIESCGGVLPTSLRPDVITKAGILLALNATLRYWSRNDLIGDSCLDPAYRVTTEVKA